MTSRTDIQHHFGRTRVDSLQIGNQPFSTGEWVQGVASFTGGTLAAGGVSLVRYTLSGKTCTAVYQLSQAGTGTATANLAIGLPFTARDGNLVTGVGTLQTAGGTNDAILSVAPLNASSFVIRALRNDVGPTVIGNNQFGFAANASLALVVSVTYEIA